jgi:hypothetical protein
LIPPPVIHDGASPISLEKGLPEADKDSWIPGFKDSSVLLSTDFISTFDTVSTASRDSTLYHCLGACRITGTTEGWWKTARCKAFEIPRNEAYITVRRSEEG